MAHDFHYYYGKKTYDEMLPEEKVVIDEFEGKDNYADTLQKQDYFIYNPLNSIPCLEMNAG